MMIHTLLALRNVPGPDSSAGTSPYFATMVFAIAAYIIGRVWWELRKGK